MRSVRGLKDNGCFAGMQEMDFAVLIDNRLVDAQTEGMMLAGRTEHDTAENVSHTVLAYHYEPARLMLECHMLAYKDAALAERWVVVRNEGDRSVTIERIDSFRLRLPEDEWRAMYYKSDWGSEFEPVSLPLREEPICVQTRQGRSSKDMHPWMTLFRGNGELLTISPMWSGNWMMRCERDESGRGYRVSGGLNDWAFFKTLAPGESMESIRVAMAAGSGSNLNTTSIPFARVGRKHWYPSNGLSRSLPTEWNHWWSYEDKTINEETFRANAAQAAKLGIEICTLDAGWFGPSDAATEWYELRGDWEKVNTARFPSGIRALSDYVHGLGMKFGLWCEIEAVGKSAELAARRPAFVARRDGEVLGYLCFGNPDVQEWAYQTLDGLIDGYNSDWIKLDFNLDPQAGCNCTDHGHGAGDGLYEHYRGYYRVLERIRAKHPEVILENCASGGLRIDLGIMRQTHTTFLSDPDWPEHSLQVFWGATTMLAADVCLHWSYSEWLGNHPQQQFRPNADDLPPHRFDYYTMIAMLRGFGLSQKLPEMPEWMRERLERHIALYKQTVKRFVREADLYRLTGQPGHDGRGERWCGFQYGMPSGEEHLLFVFRLNHSGSEPSRTIRLQGLEEDAAYMLTWLTEDKRETASGKSLMEDGLFFDRLREEEAALIHIARAEG